MKDLWIIRRDLQGETFRMGTIDPDGKFHKEASVDTARFNKIKKRFKSLIELGGFDVTKPKDRTELMNSTGNYHLFLAESR